MQKTPLARFIGYRMDNQALVNFFKEHDYVVKVVASDFDGVGCAVTFPSKKTIDHNEQETICIYQIQEDPLPSGIHYYSSESNKPVFIDCPAYAARIIIFQDILMKTERLKLSTKFIVYYNSEGEELDSDSTFIELLKPPDDEKQMLLEEKLADIFYAAYPDFTKEFLELADKENVSKGYELIHLAFLMEGL